MCYATIENIHMWYVKPSMLCETSEGPFVSFDRYPSIFLAETDDHKVRYFSFGLFNINNNNNYNKSNNNPYTEKKKKNSVKIILRRQINSKDGNVVLSFWYIIIIFLLNLLVLFIYFRIIFFVYRKFSRVVKKKPYRRHVGCMKAAWKFDESQAFFPLNI